MNKVIIHNDMNGNDYTCIVTNNIDDIPTDYEVWNTSLGTNKQVIMVHTTGFNVDTDMDMYVLETDEFTTKLIKHASMYGGLGSHADVKQQLRLLEV